LLLSLYALGNNPLMKALAEWLPYVWQVRQPARALSPAAALLTSP
jgi:hypothetical protein